MKRILAHRGASSRDDPEGGARSGVPRLRLVTAGSGRHGNRPPGTTTCAARSSLHELRRQCRRRKRGPGAQKPPRWSAERRASRVMGRVAPRKRGNETCACRRSAHPSRWGLPAEALAKARIQFNTRAQSRRGNARRRQPPSPAKAGFDGQEAMAGSLGCPPKL